MILWGLLGKSKGFQMKNSKAQYNTRLWHPLPVGIQAI